MTPVACRSVGLAAVGTLLGVPRVGVVGLLGLDEAGIVDDDGDLYPVGGVKFGEHA
jgi:hypothetical protein